MDPPEDVELMSLIEETITDEAGGGRSTSQNGSGNRQSLDAPSLDAPSSTKPPLHPSRLSQFRSYRQKQQRRTLPVNTTPPTSPSSSPRLSSTKINDTGKRTRLLLVLNLVGIVILILIIAFKTESVIEADVEAGTTYEVAHYNLTESKLESVVSSSSNSSVQSSTSASASNTNSNVNADVVNDNMIGFHSPSLENIYGANRYYKPKGVGYQVAPHGGLHPIYMEDLSESELQKLTNSDEYYTADNYELSPYADERLKLSDVERNTENIEWKNKLQSIRDTYGFWDFVDDYIMKNKKQRPTVDWTTVGNNKDKSYNPLLGEIDKEDFPKDSWQTDDVYITNFIKEGKALIKRVTDAISDEYGWDTPEKVGGIEIPDATNEDRKQIGGKMNVAWMYANSFNALAKKLLNAMLTNDHFFVTLGGHSAAAGHGNNFWQSYMMEFQRVMEPVFDRLGMVLVSSNRAQGGMGTLQAALAGTGIYGDPDFMLWDSSMTEKDGKAQDVFFRQAVLSGERVPILFDMGGGRGMMDKLRDQVGAHIGGIHTVAIFPQFKNTTIDFSDKKYNAACWTDRVDVEPPVEQYPGFGGQASWHPGNWVHQSTARKISLLFLHALDEALTLWEIAASEDGNPIDGKHWHLQKEEDIIREAAKNVNATATGCGELFPFIPRMCTTPMRGAGEWAPRHDPERSSIRSLVKPAPNGYVPGIIDVEEQTYLGRDPQMPSQRVPKGEVDVATIARSLPPLDSSRRRRRHLTSTKQSHLQHIQVHGRFLNETNTAKIIPGEGWSSHGHPTGYCDGTSNALCYREKSSHCLMSAHNDARGVLKGDGLSGWLVLQLKDVSEGIFMARMEDYHAYKSNKRTEGWEKVNNGREDERRKLKAPPPPLPPEFRFEVAINGVVISSWNSTEYKQQCHYQSYNNGICLLWNDEERALKQESGDIEFAMRIEPASGRIGMMGITHIFFA